MGIGNRIRNLYRGWWVALGGAGTLVLLNGFQSGGSIGLFFVALERHFGWSRTLISGAFSLVRLEHSLTAPLEGYLADRVGPNRMVFVGFMIGATGFLILAVVTNPIHYYIALFVITTGAGVGGLLPVLVAVNFWFSGSYMTQRNRAMGLTSSAFGLAFTLGIPVAWAMQVFGWRYTSFLIALLLYFAAYPLSRILRRPAGLESDLVMHRVKGPDKQDNFIDDQEVAFTLGQAVRTRAFWLIPAAHAATGFTTTAVSIHGIPHLTDVGLSFQTAAIVIAVQGGVEVIWRIFGSWFGDKANKRHAIAIYCLIQSIGAIILAYARSFPTALLFAVLFGIGHGGRGPLLASIRADYFGRRRYGTIFGTGNVIMSWTGLVTPILLGWLHDSQGSYLFGFLAMAACTASGSILIMLAKRPSIPVTDQT